MSVTSGLAPIETATPGVAISLVPRHAGTARAGSIHFAGTAPSMVSVNRVPETPSIARLSSWFTVGAELGIPIREGFGVLAAGSFTQAEYQERDLPDEQPADAGAFFAHVVASGRGRNQFRVLTAVQAVSASLRQSPAVRPSRRRRNRGRFWQTLVTWEWALESGARFTVNGGVPGLVVQAAVRHAGWRHRRSHHRRRRAGAGRVRVRDPQFKQAANTSGPSARSAPGTRSGRARCFGTRARPGILSRS